MAAEDDELLTGVTVERMESAGAPAQEWVRPLPSRVRCGAMDGSRGWVCPIATPFSVGSSRPMPERCCWSSGWASPARRVIATIATPSSSRWCAAVTCRLAAGQPTAGQAGVPSDLTIPHESSSFDREYFCDLRLNLRSVHLEITAMNRPK